MYSIIVSFLAKNNFYNPELMTKYMDFFTRKSLPDGIYDSIYYVEKDVIITIVRINNLKY